MLLLILSSVLLSLWFFRKNFKDGTIWMFGTYLAIAAMFWYDYTAVSAAEKALPRIVSDFLLLGMVGFVQSLAVNKRISILTAILIIFGLFAGSYALNNLIEDSALVVDSDQRQQTLLDPNAELLVQVTHRTGVASLQQLATAEGWSLAPAFAPKDPGSTELDDFYTLDVSDVAAAEAKLAVAKDIIYFEPNEQIQLTPLVDEGQTSTVQSPLSINDPFTDQQWAMRVLNMDDYYRALASQQPVKTAKIAILDTGVDGRHEDIKDNYFSINNKYDNDPMGHGTHCAGIAAGTTNNNIGIGSLAGKGSQPFVKVTSIKVLNSAGMGTQKSIIAGILEATDEGADVISLSLGGPSNNGRQKAYSQAVKYALNKGAIVVAAAGNSNMDAFDYAPANATGMITVSALDENLLRASFSNKVNRLKRGIAAPGVGIYSTTPNSTYKKFSGTSMACPFVAGLLGVMKSIDPELDAATAYNILHTTGRDVQDGSVTGRVVQPAAAIDRLLN